MSARSAHATVAGISWPDWTPTDVATLVFVVSDGRVLLIRKKRGLGSGSPRPLAQA